MHANPFSYLFWVRNAAICATVMFLCILFASTHDNVFTPPHFSMVSLCVRHTLIICESVVYTHEKWAGVNTYCVTHVCLSNTCVYVFIIMHAIMIVLVDWA